MGNCGWCGASLPPGGRFCPACGRAVAASEVPPPEAGFAGAPPWPVGPPAGTYAPPLIRPAQPGVPGVGLAGFILAILGIATAGVTCLVGLPLSCAGYWQAKREGRPVGLCVAGIVMSAIGVVVVISIVILVIVALLALPETAPNPYTY